jgi:hypothetical protein
MKSDRYKIMKQILTLLEGENLSTRTISKYLERKPSNITDRIKEYVESGFVVRTRYKVIEEETLRKCRLNKLSQKGQKHLELIISMEEKGLI